MRNLLARPLPQLHRLRRSDALSNDEPSVASRLVKADWQRAATIQLQPRNNGPRTNAIETPWRNEVTAARVENARRNVPANLCTLQMTDEGVRTSELSWEEVPNVTLNVVQRQKPLTVSKSNFSWLTDRLLRWRIRVREKRVPLSRIC